MTTGPDAGLGHRVVLLHEHTALGRIRTSSADVLLATLAGEVEVLRDRRPATTLFWGQVLTIPRGGSWSVRCLREPARLLVVAHPAGVERVVAALCADPPLEPHRRLALALEEGVELIV